MSQQRVYERCFRDGKIKEKVFDKELILAKKRVAEKGLNFINNKEILDDEWMFVFREYYESLRGLAEAFLLLHGVISDNHQCTFAYLCSQHEELLLDWNFLEIIRQKRNAINYRGHDLTMDDWNTLKLRFELHITLFSKKN